MKKRISDRNKRDFKNTIRNRIFVLVLIFSFLCSMTFGTMGTQAGTVRKKVFQGNDFKVSFVVDDVWDGGYKATVTVMNTGDEVMENWCIQFPLQEEIETVWNAVIDKKSDCLYTIKNVGWNQDIGIGKEVSFGFLAKGSFSDYPDSFCTKTEQTIVDKNEYSVHYVVSDAWEGGFNGSLEIKNNSNQCIEDWCLEMTYDAQIDNIWNAVIEEQDGWRYRIGNASYNQNIQPGATIVFGFSCFDEKSLPKLADVKMTQKSTGISTNINKEEEPEESAQPEGEKNEEGESDQELTVDTAQECVCIEFKPGNTYGCVVDDVSFINEAEGQMEVNWKSSEPSVISETGKVMRQKEDRQVTITAEITLPGGQKLQKRFVLTVIQVCNIDKSRIEDFNVTQLADMNKDNAYYDIKINDFGYVERISGKYSNVKVNSYETALYSLYSIKSAMGITDPFQELSPYDVDADDTGYIFKFIQTCQGIKTFSNAVIVSSDAEGHVDYFTSEYFPIQGKADTTPALTYEQAVEAVKAKFGEVTLVEPEERYCMLNYLGQTDFVWEVDCKILQDTEELEAGSYQLLVGGNDGEVKYKNAVESCATKRVNVSGKDMTGVQRKFAVTEKSNGSYVLKDTSRKIEVFDKDEVAITKYTKNNWSEEQVSAMANISDAYDFYESHFGRKSYNGAKTRKKGKKINVYLLGDFLYNDCKWDPLKKELRIGDGNGERHENGFILKSESLAASADLVCHEYTHAIFANDTYVGRKTIGIAGAINEAYADMGACFFDGNWTIAETSVKGDLPMRDNVDPERVKCASRVDGPYYLHPEYYFKDDPDKSKTTDYGGVHINCTILTHAVYMMKRYGIPQKELEKIWYKTIRMGYLMRANFYTVRMQFITACGKIDHKYVPIVVRAFDEANVTKDNSDMDHSGYYLKMDKKQYSASYFSNHIEIYGKAADMNASEIGMEDDALEGVEVSVLTMDQKQTVGTDLSDEDGQYQVSADVRDGYCLQYQCDGYLPEEMYLANINELIQTEYYCDTVHMVPEGKAGQGNASGVIYDALTNQGVGNITLNVRKGLNNLYTDVLQSIKTKTDGSYFLSGLEAGNYCLEMVCGDDAGYISSYFNIKVLGNETISCQNGFISPRLAQDQIRIVLTWGAQPRDLDSHLRFQMSDGKKGHISYQNHVYRIGKDRMCALDVDETKGYGPETVTVYSGKTGQYRYFVHNFSMDTDLEESDATVRVYIDGQAYPKYTFHIPGGDGEYWRVFEYNSATYRLQPINELTYDEDYEN